VLGYDLGEKKGRDIGEVEKKGGKGVSAVE